MVKGKAWSVEEERKLRELMGAGESVFVISLAVGKSIEGVLHKVRRLGLGFLAVGGGLKNHAPSSSSSSSSTTTETTNIPETANAAAALPKSFLPELQELVLPAELPTVEESLKKLAAAINALARPGLSHSEIMRLRGIAQACRMYQDMYSDFADYVGLEERLIVLEKKMDERALRSQTT